MLETLFIIVGFALILIFTGVKMVPQGHAWTVERFGRYTRTLARACTCWCPLWTASATK